VRREISLPEREALLAKAATFLEESGRVLFAYAFGSFTEGKPFEDLDLAVYPDGELGKALLRMENGLEASLGVRVELATLDKASLAFSFTVISRGRLLFSRDEKRRCDFEERTRDLYFDFQPYLQRYYREVVLGGS
jgi:predicted nucleotidyltransferase